MHSEGDVGFDTSGCDITRANRSHEWSSKLQKSVILVSTTHLSQIPHHPPILFPYLFSQTSTTIPQDPRGKVEPKARSVPATQYSARYINPTTPSRPLRPSRHMSATAISRDQRRERRLEPVKRRPAASSRSHCGSTARRHHAAHFLRLLERAARAPDGVRTGSCAARARG